MKKAILLILIIFIFVPSTSFAFDICGWWQSQKTPSVFLKITNDKFYGFDYKINSMTDNKIEIFVDHSNVPSYIEKKSADIIMITNAIGEKKYYKLVTRDTNLKNKDVEKLCGVD
ncbi:hypothetical protein [Desulfovibrio sp. ZJ200]|uniref:hypothetical protein n=1 Tax=Desulfovibrio sp. ZJ200 TaxID=2709792 RepID=UPI0013E9F763|nr:hypothetical protein [Desulfovibrio sp. ZJ200]